MTGAMSFWLLALAIRRPVLLKIIRSRWSCSKQYSGCLESIGERSRSTLLIWGLTLENTEEKKRCPWLRNDEQPSMDVIRYYLSAMLSNSNKVSVSHTLAIEKQ